MRGIIEPFGVLIVNHSIMAYLYRHQAVGGTVTSEKNGSRRSFGKDGPEPAEGGTSGTNVLPSVNGTHVLRMQELLGHCRGTEERKDGESTPTG
ncbi:hypothetical protein L484_009451 [Morus notabilis]|uniref:Uncharacterized protein n=1 Tax=Morus notabilis TaxID=981085 RepID=W9S775_9ROSA|nr:hypothetical protein L484_009451 [Morus notabilis]